MAAFCGGCGGAETVQALSSGEPIPETFTAALLHDVGKLVMGRFLIPEILGFIRRAREVDHLGRLEAESLLLNVHHGELGGLIAQHWKLPSRVVQGIIYHHNPEEGHDVICDLTYLANQIAKQIEAGLDGQQFDFTIHREMAERLCLTPKMLNDLGATAVARYTQVAAVTTRFERLPSVGWPGGLGAHIFSPAFDWSASGPNSRRMDGWVAREIFVRCLELSGIDQFRLDPLVVFLDEV